MNTKTAESVSGKSPVCSVGIDYFRLSFPSDNSCATDYLPSDLPVVKRQVPLGMDVLMPGILAVLDKFGFPVGQLKGSMAHYGFQYAVRDPLDRFTIYTDNIATGQGTLVQFEGLGCSFLGAQKTVDLIAALHSVGFCQVTRLDINVDFLGGFASGLIGQAERSYQKGHFGRIKDFQPHIGFKGGSVCNHGCGIGNRSSEKFIRIYDKGLESGEAPQGQWIRWEAELKGSKANELTKRVLAADFSGGSLQSFLASYALGEGRAARRLPSGKYRNVNWYSRLLGAAGASVLTLPCPKRVRSYLKRKQFIRRSVAPFLNAIGSEFGVSGGQVFDYFASDVSHCFDPHDIVHSLGRKEIGEWLESGNTVPF